MAAKPKPRAVVYPGAPMQRPGGPSVIPPRPKPSRHPKPAPMTPAQRKALQNWIKHHPFPKGGRKPRPKRAAPYGLMPSGGEWITGRNDSEPTCVATAIANSLLAVTGIRATEEQVMKLHRHASGGDGVSISDALASVVVNGLSGVRPAGYWMTPDDHFITGCIVGMSDGLNDHAVTYTPAGLISWGAPLDMGLARDWWTDGESWFIDWAV